MKLAGSLAFHPRLTVVVAVLWCKGRLLFLCQERTPVFSKLMAVKLRPGATPWVRVLLPKVRMFHYYWFSIDWYFTFSERLTVIWRHRNGRKTPVLWKTYKNAGFSCCVVPLPTIIKRCRTNFIRDATSMTS